MHAGRFTKKKALATEIDVAQTRKLPLRSPFTLSSLWQRQDFSYELELFFDRIQGLSPQVSRLCHKTLPQKTFSASKARVVTQELRTFAPRRSLTPQEIQPPSMPCLLLDHPKKCYDSFFTYRYDLTSAHTTSSCLEPLITEAALRFENVRTRLCLRPTTNALRLESAGENVLSFLPRLSGLVSLTIHHCAIAAFDITDHLLCLRKLDLSCNSLRSLSVSQDTRLQQTDLSFNVLTAIDALIEHSPQLQTLKASNNRIPSLRRPLKAADLCEVDLSFNLLKDINFAADLPSLARLIVEGNPLEATTPLSCPFLQELVPSLNMIFAPALEGWPCRYPAPDFERFASLLFNRALEGRRANRLESFVWFPSTEYKAVLQANRLSPWRSCVEVAAFEVRCLRALETLRRLLRAKRKASVCKRMCKAVERGLLQQTLTMLKSRHKVKRFLLRVVLIRRALQARRMDADSVLNAFTEFGTAEDLVESISKFEVATPASLPACALRLSPIMEAPVEDSQLLTVGCVTSQVHLGDFSAEDEGTTLTCSQSTRALKNAPSAFKIKTQAKAEDSEVQKLIDDWGLTKEETIRAFQKKLRKARKQRHKHYILKSD